MSFQCVLLSLFTVIWWVWVWVSMSILSRGFPVLWFPWDSMSFVALWFPMLNFHEYSVLWFSCFLVSCAEFPWIFLSLFIHDFPARWIPFSSFPEYYVSFYSNISPVIFLNCNFHCFYEYYQTFLFFLFMSCIPMRTSEAFIHDLPAFWWPVSTFSHTLSSNAPKFPTNISSFFLSRVAKRISKAFYSWFYYPLNPCPVFPWDYAWTSAHHSHGRIKPADTR